MILLLLLHLSYLGTGLVFTRSRARPLAHRLSRAYVLGIVLQIALLYAGAAFGLMAHVFPQVLFVLGLAFFLIELGRFLRMPHPLRLTTPKLGLRSVVDLALILSLLPPVVLLTLRLTGMPLISFDAIAIWAVKAKYLYFGEHLGSDAFSNPARVHPHPGYPLFLPLFFYQHQVIFGELSEWAAKTGLWLFDCVALTIFYQLIAERVGRRLALIALGLLLYTPTIGYLVKPGSVSTAYADFPLALFMLLGAGFLLRYLEREETIDLLVVVACLAGSMLLKLEGLIWVLSLLTITLFSMLLKRRRPRRRELYSLAILVAVAFGYRFAHAGLPPSSDLSMGSIDELIRALQLLPTSALQSLRRLADLTAWGALPWVVAGGYIIGFMRDRSGWLFCLSWAVLLQGGCFLFALSLAEAQHGLADLYLSVTFPRWMIQLAPVALFFAIAGSEEKADSTGRVS